MSWHLNLRHHYKIWFSKNPTEFLSFLNQLRFIRDSVKNKDASFTFVYSSKCLTAQARNDLLAFCQKINIIPFDFDTEIPKLLEDNLDKQLFERAQQELMHARNYAGGNMAAASDCARVISSVIEKCGIYSDFDVEFDFSSLPDVIPIKAPVMLPVHITQGTQVPMPSVNSEFLGFAFDPDNVNKMHKDARSALRKVQNSILKRYNNLALAMVESPIEGLGTDLLQLSDATVFIQRHFEQYENATLFSLRKSISEMTISDIILCQTPEDQQEILGLNRIDDLSEAALKSRFARYYQNEEDINKIMTDKELAKIADGMLENFKHSLYVFSVTLISGPCNFLKLYQADHPEFPLIDGDEIDEKEWKKFVKNLKNSHIDAKIEEFFKTKNSIAELQNQLNQNGQSEQKDLPETGGDQSWSLQGAFKNQLYTLKLKQAARLCQKVWREKQSKKTDEKQPAYGSFYDVNGWRRSKRFFVKR